MRKSLCAYVFACLLCLLPAVAEARLMPALSIAISAVENVSNDGVNEFDGHYADDVTLYLDRRATATSAVPEPATLGLAAVLGVLAMLCRRRGGHAGV